MKKIVFFFCLVGLAAVVGHCEDIITANIGPFGTLNNYDNPVIIPADKAQDLLNVDISPGGASVMKRKGFAQAYALGITTSPTHGVYKFFDSTGNEVILIFNDNRMSSSVNGVNPSTIFTDGPNGGTYQCVDSLGYAYCNNSSRTRLIQTNGVTFSTVTAVNSTGTLVAVTPDRLVISGFSDNPNRIDFSKSATLTNFLAPFSDGTDANQITITAPGSKITHIVYAFNRIMWFKDNSFGYVLFGPALSDWQVRTISPNVGTLDNSSIYWNDILYWRGQDGHFYSYDGANIDRMSRDITDTILQAQSRASNSWIQTSQSDFQAGLSTPSSYFNFSITPGAVALDTATAIVAFNDTSASDFSAGTLTSLTSDAGGSLALSLGSQSTMDFFYSTVSENPLNTCNSPSTQWTAQSFTASSSYVITGVTLRLMKQGAASGTYTVSIYSDSSGTPGSQLTSTTLNASEVQTTTADANISISSQTVLMSTTYWIRIDAPSSCSNTPGSLDRIFWYLASPDGSNPLKGIVRNNSGIVTTSSNLKFKSNGKQYSTTGNIVSRSFDVSFTTNTWLWEWREFTASGTIPSSTSISYETQTSSSSSGVFDSLVSVSTGSIPTSTVRRYIRYKASFATSNISTSPVLNDVFINMSKRIRPGATYYSQINNAPNLTAWNTFDAVTNGLGTITYAVRSATSNITILSSSPTFTSVANGAIPAIAVSTYMQVQAVITTTSPFVEPNLNQFSLGWFEGSAADKAYGGYFDYGLWWNVQLGTGSTYNNYVIKYDMINNGFVLYDIPMNGFYVRNGSLYFGSSSSGYVFKYGDVDNDNGSAIEAYWKSKDFISGQDPFLDTDYSRLSFMGKSVQSSSITVTYTRNGQTSTSYTVPMYASNSAYRFNKVNLPLGTQGDTFSVKYGNDAADQFFQIFAVQYGYKPKSWIPRP